MRFALNGLNALISAISFYLKVLVLVHIYEFDMNLPTKIKRLFKKKKKKKKKATVPDRPSRGRRRTRYRARRWVSGWRESWRDRRGEWCDWSPQKTLETPERWAGAAAPWSWVEQRGEQERVGGGGRERGWVSTSRYNWWGNYLCLILKFSLYSQ